MRRPQPVSLVSLALVLGLPLAAQAEDFYVDPESGSASGDGSAANPWRTLEEVVAAGLIATRDWESHPPSGSTALVPVNASAPIGSGDTVWLRSGDHGALVIEGAYNEGTITIAAEAGHTPRLSSVLFRAASGWVLRGVSVSPSYAAEYSNSQIVTVEDHGFRGPSDHVVIEGCEIFSERDTSGWSASDWVARAANGIGSSSSSITIVGNELTNVRFGVSMTGPDARVIGNSIRNFSGDGMRGLGDRGLFEGNYVANAYDVDENHDDGFQSWSLGPGGVGTGEVTGVVLRGNTIVNYEDPAQPLRGPLQGIGCFDGTFVDWVVENNVIVVDHWHGITLLGARGSRVVNNTLIDPNDDSPGPPWVRIANHKDGTESTGCTVRNNLTTAVNVEGPVVEDGNLLIGDPSALFVGPTFPYDLHLLEGSAAVDVGLSELAPATDLEGIARPQGAGVDVGAYEWHEEGVLPVTDGGPPVELDAGPGVDAGPSGADGGAVLDGAVLDGGAAPGVDAGEGGATEGGCGCRVGGVRLGRTGEAAASLALLLVLGRRRRRRA